MFKFVLSSLLLFVSLKAFAQTRIEITPMRPVNCMAYNYPNVNWLYDLKKLSEDKKTVVFEVVVQHGHCDQGRTIPKLVNPRYAGVDLLRDGLVLPWQKEGAKAKVYEESPSELRIELIFNKKVLFKKQNERTLSMLFRPGEKFGPVYYIQQGYGYRIWQADLTFPWRVYLTQDENHETSIEFLF